MGGEFFTLPKGMIFSLAAQGECLLVCYSELIFSNRKPLCDFLEKPIPECDFPRGNGAEEFFTRFAAVEAARRAQARRNMKVVGLIASSLLSAGVAFMILRNKK